MYIVYISFSSLRGEYSLTIKSKEDLDIIINAYKQGKSDFTISGIKHPFVSPKIFAVYEILDSKKLNSFIKSRYRFLIKDRYIKERPDRSITLKPKLLSSSEFFKNVTAIYIGNMAYGELKSHSSDKSDYISIKRIKELEQITNGSFDLNKLIQFCKELNDNWHMENYLSVGVLVRALKDHVPKIFGCNNFNEVANNYSSAGRSFKSSMITLQTTSKDISDRLIHSHITNSETLPVDTQVDFRQNLDVLLEQIVRLLK